MFDLVTYSTGLGQSVTEIHSIFLFSTSKINKALGVFQVNEVYILLYYFIL